MLYISIILIFYFVQALVLPKILSVYVNDPKKRLLFLKSSHGYFSQFYPLLGIFFILILLIFIKNRIDAILPTMHFRWLRDTIFEDMVWTYQEQKDSIPIGVFMMRYNLLPQEIRIIFEDILETLPVILSLFYLFIYFCCFSVPIGMVYIMLYGCLFLYLIFSKESIRCQKAVEERAQETIQANDTASQEVLNLNHIYTNQVEEEHIRIQSIAEEALQKKWQTAQMTVNNLLFQINAIQWFILGVLLALFFQYFRSRPNQRQYWASVFLIMTFTHTTLLTTTPRWVNLINGITMIRIYQESISTMSKERITSPPKESNDSRINSNYSIIIDHLYLTLGTRTIFSDFSMTFPQGQKILVQGASGSGKTSFFHLLTRYISTYNGDIIIGGVNLKEWNLQDLRRRIVHIPQQTHLFDNTIIYNICVGECSPEQRQQVEDIIRHFGWERILGKDLNKSCGVMGKNVSHGMQKLIILLRLLWKIDMARIILIDEPLASLDQQTQDDVIVFLSELSKDKTLFINNHVQLTTRQYQYFDRVLDSSTFLHNRQK
jgi:ABC-type multidrug transport system fused ATPase/permease subunit